MTDPRVKSARPAVLAHTRFQAERARFAGLTLAARFELIARRNLWGAVTTVSGLGSEPSATAPLRAALPSLLAQLEVRTLLDAPCGALGWMVDVLRDVRHARAQANAGAFTYAGVDIVGSVIDDNLARSSEAGLVDTTFTVADVTRDVLPVADAILCRDCLVHLSFANIRRALERFRATGATWLLTTHFTRWEENADCDDGDWRALNFERAPFFWPAPLLAINERCTEAAGAWDDKELSVWRLADLP